VLNVKISDVSHELNVSPTTIYRVIQKLKLDEHVSREQGVKILDPFAVSKIKEHFQRLNNVKQSSNNVQGDSRLVEQLLKENANRYTWEGRLTNFCPLKKIDKKVLDKKLNMTYSEFKKLQQESQNKK
jgi:DeoR/GlpR family transcriptional regulator of sugar metabolism